MSSPNFEAYRKGDSLVAHEELKPFHATDPFLYLLKTPEKLWF